MRSWQAVKHSAIRKRENKRKRKEAKEKKGQGKIEKLEKIKNKEELYKKKIIIIKMGYIINMVRGFLGISIYDTHKLNFQVSLFLYCGY